MRGAPDPTTPRPDPASQSYLWVGGLIIAVGGCGLLHLTNSRPGLDAPTAELVGAGGLLGVAAAGPLAAGIAPWGAGLILGALVLAGLVVLTRVPVRAAAESTAAATRPAGLALVDAAKRVGANLFSLGGAPTPAHGIACSTRTPTTLIDLDAAGGPGATSSARPGRASPRCSSPNPTSRCTPSSSRSSSAPR